jgi:sec-independent protein translocase protein TatA
MFGLGTPELVIILVIILVIFGGSQLPKLARSLGQSAKELRSGLNGEDDDVATDDKKKSDSKTASKTTKKQG